MKALEMLIFLFGYIKKKKSETKVETLFFHTNPENITKHKNSKICIFSVFQTLIILKIIYLLYISKLQQSFSALPARMRLSVGLIWKSSRSYWSYMEMKTYRTGWMDLFFETNITQCTQSEQVLTVSLMVM